jgi:hypothetical protein
MSNQIIRNGPPAWLRALREQQAGRDHEEVIESATQFNGRWRQENACCRQPRPDSLRNCTCIECVGCLTFSAVAR